MIDINNYDVIADLYDTYVPATFDIDFFVREAKKVSGEVLELMSGTGRVSIPLLEAGIRLTCVDISAELNAVFKTKLAQTGLRADIYQMDICALDLPKQFDQIIIPFHSFAHIVSPGDQREALDRIHRHLSPGGTFICTLGNPALRMRSVDGQLHLFREYPLPDGQGVLLLWILEDLDANDRQVVRAKQFYEEYDARGVLRTKRLLELHFRLSSKDDFEQLAKAAGFTIQALYGDYAYAAFYPERSTSMVYLLGKAS